ncbi:MAG: carboxylating nicotinate-nucleotide diphosphorylase [Deltaproteobacteria bacterium]|nr:MAG: carboxylating nicotinate-nucleotide diphosphorylase [Deltaproteobacteria bacterium]
MAPRLTRDEHLDRLLALSLAEDLGSGDITTLATVPARLAATAVVTSGEPCVVAGLALFDPLAEMLKRRGRADEEADSLALRRSVGDGSEVAAGAVVCEFSGSARALLVIERTFLNYLGRLSGIATLTARFVRAAGGVRILDTRKTTPGHRALEKYAVRCGGGSNHRFGLFDAVLIKDNHIAAAGGVRAAVEKVRAACRATVEVECDTLEQVEEALEAGADTILLDNFTPADAGEAVRVIAGRARVEASGGIDLETVAAYAAAGVDDVSVGCLTHSAPAIDFSMAIEASP